MSLDIILSKYNKLYVFKYKTREIIVLYAEGYKNFGVAFRLDGTF